MNLDSNYYSSLKRRWQLKMDVLLEALNLPFGQPNAFLGQIYNASPQQKALPLGQHLLITYL